MNKKVNWKSTAAIKVKVAFNPDFGLEKEFIQTLRGIIYYQRERYLHYWINEKELALMTLLDKQYLNTSFYGYRK